MTTSYKLEAVKNLKVEKEAERIREAEELKAAQDAEEKKHQANLDRIANKMARIEAGLPVEEEVVEKPAPKKAAAKKKAPAKKKATAAKKKPAAKKKGRPKKSK